MQKIYRIFDANINRALEGLRVVEEIARFILEDKKLSSKIKGLRGKVKYACSLIPQQQLIIKIRDSKKDVGWKVYPKSESSRADIISIYKANIKRATEALRVLEEFTKLINPGAGRAFKDLRFMVYDLEKELYEEISDYLKQKKLNFNLYVIIDPAAHGKNIFKITQKVLKSGVKFIQYRDKKASSKKFLNNAQKIKRLTDKYKAVLIINDHINIAKKINADGVHIGQEDIPPRKVREMLGDEKIIGISTHSYKQACRAARSPVDYLSCGPIFKTKTKPWRRAVGLPLLKKVVKSVKKPIVAIGGIDKNNLQQVKKTGVKRIAVINAWRELI
ncbi:MAG: thiamine phosphate synthase [Candidatus Margulisbacteria bacterium]|nr:thiamine phosphate synthase [Candidatus Margulisiibacteriota bacterium]MBU1021683.1 thiamine phosphate synthase [Candidatus Margulisiibacteriota bacterium]MBU1729561.1 thiamine phosphate synthase [Candidatus Margulisiibacteriota bacterium]MBU1955047.1 thiamine phosphate synthase [Candidatus Margulisiibacteriota bacterium]